MSIDLETYGRNLNIRPAGDDGAVECRWPYPPPCEGSQPEICRWYSCDRRGGEYTGPEVSLAQCRAEARVRKANELAKK